MIEELTAQHQELGKATKEDKEGSSRRVAGETLTYLSNQQDKMRYDEYLEAGLAAEEQPRRAHDQADQLAAEGDGEVLDGPG